MDMVVGNGHLDSTNTVESDALAMFLINAHMMNVIVTDHVADTARPCRNRWRIMLRMIMPLGRTWIIA